VYFHVLQSPVHFCLVKLCALLYSMNYTRHSSRRFSDGRACCHGDQLQQVQDSVWV
jgi:hypothetical protein